MGGALKSALLKQRNFVNPRYPSKVRTLIFRSINLKKKIPNKHCCPERLWTRLLRKFWLVAIRFVVFGQYVCRKIRKIILIISMPNLGSSLVSKPSSLVFPALILLSNRSCLLRSRNVWSLQLIEFKIPISLRKSDSDLCSFVWRVFSSTISS